MKSPAFEVPIGRRRLLLAGLAWVALSACSPRDAAPGATAEAATPVVPSPVLANTPADAGSSVAGKPWTPGAPASAPGASYVPLTLAAAPAASGIPVRSGIPFPLGALKQPANVRLETNDGRAEVPAQVDALSRWPDGSVKSALVQFVADAGESRPYRIAYGDGVARAAFPSGAAISVTRAANGITVDTGALRFVVDTKGLVNGLWRDADHDGRYAAQEQVLGAGDAFMVNAFDGLEYTARQQRGAAELTIEENGPVRAVVRARGALVNAQGQPLVKFQARYSAYVGADKLDIEFTVTDDRLEANVDRPGTTLALAAKGYGLRWTTLADAARYRFGLEGGRAAEGDASGDHHLLQTGRFVYDNGVDKGHLLHYAGVAEGKRAPGWMALDGGSRHLALMLRDFWQQFPAELDLDGRTLTASLFAQRSLGDSPADTTLPVQQGTQYKRPNDFYFLRPGGAKTHQLRFAFADSTPGTEQLARLNEGFQRHRLELAAEPAWYADSGVFGHIDTGNPRALFGYSAMLLHDIYEPSLEKPSPENLDPSELGGDATMFGWRDYGDRLRAGWNNVVNGVRIPAFYNDTHIGANNFFKEFLRTGEQRWFELGELSTRHFADIDVAHGPRKGYWDEHVRGLGVQPPGEVHASGHNNEDHQQRNLHWGHAHVSGLSDFYLLTGDKRSLEVLTEIANWWKFVTPHFFKTPFDKSRFREAERDYAWPLYVMNEYVRVSGDAQYHKAVSGQLVNYLVQWWQTPLDHVGYNPATQTVGNALVNVNDAVMGTGYWTMSRMDNANGTNATGTNPWMAGPLLSSVIGFYEQDKLMAAAGHGAGIDYATLEDMLFQCMNYVVKYGYDPKVGFVYSEVTRGYTGGHTLIDYPLAYLDKLYKRRVADGTMKHAAWYDTEPAWGPIAKRNYEQLVNARVGANTQSYGFYGYEMVTPVDFFRLMSEP